MALPPMDLLEKQISKSEHHLLMYILLEQRETNRLLAELIMPKETVSDTPDAIDGYKRQDLMKHIAKLASKPQGWQKYGTEDMRKLLKEAQ